MNFRNDYALKWQNHLISDMKLLAREPLASS